jgi:hypothetical protein
MKVSYGERLGAAMLAAVPAGESPAGGTCPVAAVVIPGDGKSDRPVESPEVKASVGWARCSVGSAREASNPTGRSEMRTCEASKSPSHLKRMVGEMGVSSRSSLGEDQRRRRRNWARAADGLPGVEEDGMSGRSVQRKHGTTRRRESDAYKPQSGEVVSCRRVGRMRPSKR